MTDFNDLKARYAVAFDKLSTVDPTSVGDVLNSINENINALETFFAGQEAQNNSPLENFPVEVLVDTPITYPDTLLSL